MVLVFKNYMCMFLADNVFRDLPVCLWSSPSGFQEKKEPNLALSLSLDSEGAAHRHQFSLGLCFLKT